MKFAFAISIALTLGILALALVGPYGADQEHWDNPIYWQVAYPATCFGCATLGYLFSRGAWYYGLAAIFVQAVLPILSNLDAELIGVSLAMLVALSVPPTFAGLFGSWARSRVDSRVV